MKNWTQLLFLQLICILALSTAPSHANAAGFADSFRAFVLEEDTPSQVNHVVSLPSNSQSATCVQCHNGHRASGIALKNADAPMSSGSHRNTNHPVGMSYSRYARMQPQSYVQPARLNANIQLEDGQVTCVSCHAVKQAQATWNTGELIASVDQTAASADSCTATKRLTTGPNPTSLCMSCHAM